MKAKIVVRQFAHGNQGQLDVREVVERTVTKSSCFAPRQSMCADLPLEKTSYWWIEYGGDRFAVRPLSSDATPEGHPFELCLASDWKPKGQRTKRSFDAETRKRLDDDAEEAVTEIRRLADEQLPKED